MDWTLSAIAEAAVAESVEVRTQWEPSVASTAAELLMPPR